MIKKSFGCGECEYKTLRKSRLKCHIDAIVNCSGTYNQFPILVLPGEVLLVPAHRPDPGGRYAAVQQRPPPALAAGDAPLGPAPRAVAVPARAVLLLRVLASDLGPGILTHGLVTFRTDLSFLLLQCRVAAAFTLTDQFCPYCAATEELSACRTVLTATQVILVRNALNVGAKVSIDRFLLLRIHKSNQLTATEDIRKLYIFVLYFDHYC